MKKLLYITHFSGLHVNRFWLTSIAAAHELGYEFHLACNMRGADPEEFPKECSRYGITAHQIDFERSPLSVNNVKAYKQLVNLMKKEQFDIVHCNTPIGGILGRICARRAGAGYVIYQAHGFHFWKGAPLKNRLIYYPVERMMARYTDTLLTINQEDYQAASGFKLKRGGSVRYIAGVGVDVERIRNTQADLSQKRKELGIPENAKVFLNIAEFIDRKNQETIVRAFDKADLSEAYLLFCGKGRNVQKIADLIEELGRQDQIKILGYRTDVMELLKVSDCFVFASYQEGLPVALMEAMASGVPCIASRIRGNTDLLPESRFLFDPADTAGLAELLKQAGNGAQSAYEVQENLKRIRLFDSSVITRELTDVYRNAALQKDRRNKVGER